MILLIDNYDSFSYNLYQLLGTVILESILKGEPGGVMSLEQALEEAENRIQVIRNDELTTAQIEALCPEGIILSPGPGRPEDAGICIEVVEKLGSRIPILGVCLGHQSICRAYGAEVSYAKELMHGKQSEVSLDTDSLIFRGLPSEVRIGRYHSLAALEETMPEALQVTARTGDGEIMAVQHRDYPVCGLQFHPESILTPDGRKMLANWYMSLGNGS